MPEYNGATVRDYSVDRMPQTLPELRSSLKLQGTAPANTQTGTPVAAIDPATTMALVNDLRAKLIALGIIS